MVYMACMAMYRRYGQILHFWVLPLTWNYMYVWPIYVCICRGIYINVYVYAYGKHGMYGHVSNVWPDFAFLSSHLLGLRLIIPDTEWSDWPEICRTTGSEVWPTPTIGGMSLYITSWKIFPVEMSKIYNWLIYIYIYI